MSRLQWDETGKRFYETGIDRVVLYVLRSAAAWNGITAINESPSGAEPTKIYADNIVYGVLMSPEEDVLTVEAFAYPDLFNRCIGRIALTPGAYICQQNYVPFGLCYRTKIRNDQTEDAGYKIHIVPFLYVTPSEDSNSTISDSPEPETFSWNMTALPVPIDDDHSTAMITLDSRWYNKNGLWNALTEIEKVLYGSDTSSPKLITYGEIESIVYSAYRLLDDSGNEILDENNEPILTAVYKK